VTEDLLNFVAGGELGSHDDGLVVQTIMSFFSTGTDSTMVFKTS